MNDNGFAFITEPNALESLIAPPTMLGKIAEGLLGSSNRVSETLGAGISTNIPWRKAKVVSGLKGAV